jgi:hypothetical protein
MPAPSELWQAVLPIIAVLEELDVPYYLGGSVASSFIGVARSTQDVDLVADLELRHTVVFLERLAATYYLDSERLEEAIRRRRSVNAIHLATMFKVDLFVSPHTSFARANLSRRQAIEIPELGRSLFIAAAEDLVLHKLLWYAEGGRVSERQWYDLQGVLRLQRSRLDRGYLNSWARELEVSELLDRALGEAEGESE